MKKAIKILVIDKEEIILKSVKRALKNEGEIEFIITTCGTALDGLKLIRSDKFDLIFFDLVLPGMSGSELLRRIKNMYPDVPVIVMSGYSGSGINRFENTSLPEDIRDNISGFLLKPFTTEEIKSVIYENFSFEDEER